MLYNWMPKISVQQHYSGVSTPTNIVYNKHTNQNVVNMFLSSRFLVTILGVGRTTAASMVAVGLPFCSFRVAGPFNFSQLAHIFNLSLSCFFVPPHVRLELSRQCGSLPHRHRVQNFVRSRQHLFCPAYCREDCGTILSVPCMFLSTQTLIICSRSICFQTYWVNHCRYFLPPSHNL